MVGLKPPLAVAHVESLSALHAVVRPRMTDAVEEGAVALGSVLYANQMQLQITAEKLLPARGFDLCRETFLPIRGRIRIVVVIVVGSSHRQSKSSFGLSLVRTRHYRFGSPRLEPVL